ncbi:MAG: hypothetical protein ACRC6E_06770 [Fusobacteriaceae bacterium]
MKKETLKQLKGYNIGDLLILESRNYLWKITKEENYYRLNIKQRDYSYSNLNHLEGSTYKNIKDIEKVIFERVSIFEFITF